jgi:recombinational DNA repair protein (RecF pathway)
MEAIMLARRDFREYDQVVSAYTRGHGKVELFARGVKKIISKNTAHLEPFSYVDIAWVPGKELDYLTTVQPYSIFPKIRNDVQGSMSAWYVVELVDRQIEVGHADRRVYDLLLSWLQMVEKTNKFTDLLLDAFVMKFFALLGFRPELSKCVVSEIAFRDLAKQEIEGVLNGKPGLYFQGGGLITPEARKGKEMIGEEIADAGLKEISGMKMLLDADWGVIDEFILDKDEEMQLHKLVYAYVLYHSEKKVSDWHSLA